MNVDKIIDCLILYNDQVESEMSIAKEIADYLNTNSIAAQIISGNNPSSGGKEIDSALVLVVLYSEQTNNSEVIKSCINTAFNQKKAIIPFVLDSSSMDDELFYYLNRKHWIVANKKIEESLMQLLSALRVVLGRTQSYSSSSFFIKIYPNEDTHIFIRNDYKGIAKAYQWFKFPVNEGVEYDISLRAVENPLLKIDYNKIKIIDEDLVLHSDFSCLRQQIIESVDERMALFKTAEIYDEYNGYRRYKLYDGLYNKYYGCGYINKYYQCITEGNRFQGGDDFRDGYATVKDNNLEGLIDIFGRLIIPIKYKRVYFCCEDFIFVQNDNWRAGVMNVYGETRIECKYDTIWTEFEDSCYFRVELNNMRGIINNKGVEFWDNEYGRYSCVNDPMIILFIRESEIDILNEDGEKLHTIKNCSAIGSHYNGIVSFERNNRWGLYNIYEQKEIQPAIYRCILPISEGIAAVVDDSNKVGFVDIHGNIIIDYRYDNPYPEKLEKPHDLLHLLKRQEYFIFKNGLCKVYHKRSSTHFINSAGEICI